jgi:hypothetical protein
LTIGRGRLAPSLVVAVGAALLGCSGGSRTVDTAVDASSDGPGSTRGPDADASTRDGGEIDVGGEDAGATDAPRDVPETKVTLDAVVDAPAGLDGSPAADGGDAAGDGTKPVDATPDAPPETDGDAASDTGAGVEATIGGSPTLTDLMALCQGGGDVFYVETVGTGTPSVQVFDDTNAQWSASSASLAVSVHASTPGGGAQLSITSTPGIPIVPGTYAQPNNQSNPRPYLGLALADVDLTISGNTSGNFFVDDVNGAGASGRSDAVLAVSFEISLPFVGGGVEYRGCVRYGPILLPDAGGDATLGSVDAGGDGEGGASCGDVNRDGHNCGVCGHDCLGGACSAGVCMPVVLFSENNGTPQGIAVDDTNVYWVETEGSVRMAPKAGGAATLLATEPRGPTALVLDSGVLYWVSQAATLRRLRLGDAAPTTLASLGGESFGVAVDATYVYWTAIAQNPDGSPAGTVGAMAKVGGATLPIASSQNAPGGVVLGGGGVYWVDLDSQLPQGTSSLLRGSLDGGAPTTIFPPSAQSSPVADAIAVDATYVYFTSGGNLYKAPLAAGPATILASGLDATALAVDDSGVYAVVRSAVLKAPLAGGVALTMTQGLFNPRGLALDAQAVYFTDFDVVMKIAK